MPKPSPAGQLSLNSLFDKTAISSVFTLAGESIARPVFDGDEDGDQPEVPPAAAFRPPARELTARLSAAARSYMEGQLVDRLPHLRPRQEAPAAETKTCNGFTCPTGATIPLS